MTIKKGEVPVFWACGVTPQAVVMEAKPDLCITHTPGHMFISDILNEELAASSAAPEDPTVSHTRTLAVLLLLASTSLAAKPKSPEPAERVLAAEDLAGISFRSIGPANMGGRVSAIAYVPGSLTSFYVGFGIGGVFRTDNMGVTFRPVFDEYPVLSIGAIAVADAPADWPGWASEKESAADPNQGRSERGKGKIVWVGTDEGNNRNSSSWGHGVYRSVDGGATFKSVGLQATHDIPARA